MTTESGEGRRDDDDDERGGPLVWLSTRAGLVILIVLGAIVGLRLVSKWLKWLLFGVVVAAAIYLIKSRKRDEERAQP